MAKKQVLKQKAKKKKWFPLYGPALFGNQLIGESYVEESAQIKGKFISANLSTIANDMKKQNLTVKLRVNKVTDGKGQTEIIGIQLVQGFVKRLVRRGRSKVDDSFTVKSKDGQLVRIKPLILTNTNCVASTASQIRLEARKILSERFEKSGFINMIQDILAFKVQKETKELLNKIHPIKSVDIRVLAREVIRGNVPEAELTLIPEEEVKVEKEAVAEETEVVEEAAEEPVKEEAPVEEVVEEKPAKEEPVAVEEPKAEEAVVEEPEVVEEAAKEPSEDKKSEDKEKKQE